MTSRPGPEIRELVACRGRRAAAVLGWSRERLDAFLDEAGSGRIRGATPRPEEFGLSEDDAFSPGPDPMLEPRVAAALGRWSASRALWSWAAPEPDVMTDGDAFRFSLMWLDRFESEAICADAVSQERIDPASVLAALYDDPEAWIAAEHHAALEDGRAGYADLLVERIREPVTIRRYECGKADIADGWHRTAAALLTGGVLSAVVVALPGDQPDPSPGW
ncbi:MAG: hypothetical protein DI629_20760 [Mesorhizobium amorphae]|nr:MAG: hypothetical protein DI629_20760 [Mesorhizobium amorphae]